MKKMFWVIMCSVLTVSCATQESGDGGSTAQTMQQPMSDDDMGLSKESVFATPTPEATEYGGNFPGRNESFAKSYYTAPPMIPHKIEQFIPVKIGSNACLGCHFKPGLIGKKIKGVATPMSLAHYTDPRDGREDMSKVDGSRYVCTQCHAPQANAKDLVGNTFAGQ